MSLYTPPGNSVLERAHGFVKQKIIAVRAAVPGIQLDEVVPQIQFAYNISPGTSTQESPFFLYYRRDPIIPRLSNLLQHKMRYMGNNSTGLLINAMYVIYQEMVANLIKSRQCEDPKINMVRGPMFSVNDMVLWKDPKRFKLDPPYKRTYRVLKLVGDKMADIIDNKGMVRRATFKQLKRITPTEGLLTQVPTNLMFGRQAKYLKSSLPQILKDVFETIPPPKSYSTLERTCARRIPGRKPSINTTTTLPTKISHKQCPRV